MHNVEFLPSWYSALQRRKCAMIVQAAASAAILFVLGVAAFGKEWDIHRQQQVVARFDQQIEQQNLQLDKLDQILVVQQGLREHERVISQSGIDMDATRLLSALQGAMPDKMALTGLSAETQDQPTLPGNQPADASADRWLSVRMQGVAPTDVQVAMLLDNLSRLKFLDSVGMTYIRDRNEAGHSMRDFELRFRVKLNAAMEGGT